MTGQMQDTNVDATPAGKASHSKTAIGAPTMTADEVIAALSFIPRGTSPRQALEAALDMREELTPQLLAVLSLAPIDVQSLADSVADDDTSFYLHQIAMYLLAAWREPRAWPVILDFFVSDDDVAQELLDIGAEADLPAILVRCYDGSDLGHFERIIETAALDPLFRQVCLQAYHGLVITGQAPRDRFIAFLAGLLDAPSDATSDDWYDWLAYRAAQVQEPSLRPAIEAILDRGLTAYQDTFLSLISRKNLDSIYADDAQCIADDILHGAVFDDLPDSICRWSWFTNEEPAQGPLRIPMRDAETFADAFVDDEMPLMEMRPKIGRNEPCHCGSGKKYKNCCLDQDQEARF